ncbi:hypothetical protein RFI_33875, partial [Reticulomyxa filosa]
KIANNDIETMQNKVKQEILEWISGSILTATSMVTDDNKDEPVQQFLAKMDNFMEDLQLVTTHIHPCFPPKYKILPFYIDNYLKILTAPLMNRLDANMVKTQERLSIVSWIDRFTRKIEDLRSKRSLVVGDEEDTRGQEVLGHLSDQKEALLRSYVDTCAEKIQTWVDNILDEEMKTCKEVMVNDVPHTHMPQDLFTTLNHQFDTAQEKLKGHALVQVLQMILKCMDGFRQKLQQRVDEKWKNWSDLYLCALINSCHDISEKLKERMDVFLLDDNAELYNLEHGDKEKLYDDYDSKLCAFTNLATLCVRYVVQLMMDQTIKPKLFDTYFTKEWFESPELIQSWEKTLDEFFQDYEKWMCERYFFQNIFVKVSCVEMVEEYLVTMARKKPKYSAQELTERIQLDSQVMDAFYKKWDMDLKESLMKIQHVTVLLQADSGFRAVFEQNIRDMRNGKEIMEFIDTFRPSEGALGGLDKIFISQIIRKAK